MNLRDIHAHVPIHMKDAEDWLVCMTCALDDIGIHGPARAKIDLAFDRAAKMLVNRDGP